MMYGFIIDTDSYSGNFERGMCAFMTGIVGDCGKGAKEQAAYFKDYANPVANVIRKPDEHECRRPVCIYPTPHVWNNGLGFYFKEGEEKLALEKYKEYWIDYQTKNMETVKGHRGKQIPTWTDAAIDRAVQGYEESIEEVKMISEVSKHPAYQSVLIYFAKPIEPDVIVFLKQRAYLFSAGRGITITGFRMYGKDGEGSVQEI